MLKHKIKKTKIKAYIFDLFGTLAYYTMRKEIMEFVGEEYEHLFVTSLAKSKLPEERKKQFIELYSKSKILLYEDSKRVIKKLKKNYKLGMISNLCEDTVKKVREDLKVFLKNFDVIAISSELGFMKPAHRIFIYTLDQLGVRPEEAIMIGDKLERDIIPAQQLGMGTILIDRNTQTLKELI